MNNLNRRDMLRMLASGTLAAVAPEVLAGWGGGGAGMGSGAFGGKNATYSGNLQVTQSGFTNSEPVDLVLTQGRSSQIGTIFRKSDGTVLNMTGSTNSLVVTASPPDTELYRGTLLLGGSGASVTLTGTNNTGPVTANGSFSPTANLSIAGLYDVTQKVTYTISGGGQSQTNTVTSTGSITLEQTGSSVQYTVPMTNLLRTGSITGNTLTLTGAFVEALSGSDVSFSANQAHLTVDISNEYNFKASGQGNAAGLANGVPFTVTGTATATLIRRWDVAVAVLNGGPIAIWPTPFENIDNLRAQAASVDPTRVIAKWFIGNFNGLPDQSQRVSTWLSMVNSGASSPASIMLVGHSLGGDAVRRFTTQVSTRMTIDPINADVIVAKMPNLVQGLNQRGYAYPPEGQASNRFVNVLSDATVPLWNGLLGYSVFGATYNTTEKGSNHDTVINAVVSNDLVEGEVNLLLGLAEAPGTKATRQSKLLPLRTGSAVVGRCTLYCCGVIAQTLKPR